MANGFGSLYVGASGLTSAQNALNTTANNLANVETKGYVREQVRFADMTYTTLRQGDRRVNMQQSGLGVSIGDVVHARDVFLDKAYRTEAARQSYYQTLYTTTTEVEDLFQELDGEEFKQSVQDLWQAFQELAKAPDDSTNHNLILQKAELLTTRSKAVYDDLKNYQSKLNIKVKEDVDRINAIGNKIHEINEQINKVEAGGVETAMTLRDERDNLIDELSGYGRIEVSEDQFGTVFISFEGTEFIDESRCYNIGLLEEKGTNFYTPYWPQLSDVPNERYTNVFDTNVSISEDNGNDSGQVKAHLIARGDGYGRYGDLQSVESYNKLRGSIIMESQAEVDALFHTIVTSINDLYCPNLTVSAKAVAADGTLSSETKYKILDVENCARDLAGDIPPEEIFTRLSGPRYTKMTLEIKISETETQRKECYVYNEETFQNEYSLDNIQINDTLKKQISKMPAYTANGAVDVAMARDLAQIWADKGMKLNPYDTSPCTFETYYDKIISRLGTVGNTYKSESETLSDTVTSIDNKRKQISGVSSDEELTSMIKYQAAYNAASRYISVISEMTELIVTQLNRN